jgi:aspartate aminotransferase
MTGFRLGYAAGPEVLIKSINLLHSQSTSSACSLSQAAAIVALEASPEFFDDWKHIFNDRRRFVHKAINDIDELSCSLPQGAFYMYVNCEKLINTYTPDGIQIKNDEDVCAYLLKQANVAVVPGSVFGLSPYFRISYATSIDYLQEGCKRIQQAVSQLTLNSQ